MIVSDIESEEYGKHYGTQRYNYIADGNGLSDPRILKGNVRGIYDTFLYTHDVEQLYHVKCWKFNEAVTLLNGTLEVLSANISSSDIRGDIYDSDKEDANFIIEAFSLFSTEYTTNGRRGLDVAYATNIPAGSTLSFTSLSGDVLAGIQIAYSLIFMSAL